MSSKIRPRVVLALLLAAIVLGISLAGCSSDSTAPLSVAVRGNQLVDGRGGEVVLRGVSRASGEYACIDGWGVLDGPVDQGSVDAMRSWSINAVRLPLNSACWLDIESQFATYNPSFAGAAYQDAVAQYVDLLNANGIYVILDLQWSGCGEAECLANWLKPMPDRPNATAFWTSVAERFRDNAAVLFDLYNEPNGVDWECWQEGGCALGSGDQQYIAEGMQQMVDAVRAAGATTQPLLLGGLQYANDMTGWLSHLPTDPNDSLVASIHLYDFNWPCPLSVNNERTAQAAIACFSSTGVNPIDPIVAEHPVVFGELGQEGCGTDFVEPMLDWIEQRGFGVLGWAWNVADCSSFPALISDYSGTPTAFGQAFRDHYTSISPTPGPGASAGPASGDVGASGLPTGGQSGTSTQILSRGRPAYTSDGTGPFAGANDDSYATAWQVAPGATEWLAYDLSQVPSEQRVRVVLAWYTQLDDGFTTERIEGSCPVWEGRPFLGDYVLQISEAPGGGQPPESGWRTVTTVEGNRQLSGQHMVELGQANWIRVQGSGPNGVQINVDVADASDGTSGGWLFMGDSITAAYAGHNALRDANGIEVPSLVGLVASTSSGAHEPLGQNNGVSCAYASGAVKWIDSMLDEFHGSFVTLNFGTNDSWGGQGDPEQYFRAMEQMVATVEKRGLVAVVPTIPWPNNPGDWDAKVRAMNEQVRRIYDEHPSVAQGPDLYALLEDRPELFNAPGDVHPNEAGSALIRQAWADEILANAYR